MHRICVFCGASLPKREMYISAAQELGRVIADAGLELVYGGGRTGLMGVVADAALEAGARVTGVTLPELMAREMAHTGIHDLRTVDTLARRKEMMFDLSDAFVALPGGYGTLDELLEAVTMTQLNFHQKPVGLLEVNHFFEGLIEWLDTAVLEGFVKPQNRGLLIVDTHADRLLEKLKVWTPFGSV
jgi:uncharacterized protein (TIGR00730 family)